jgi:GNAT superfamily N-acetyltransferase
MTIIIRGLKERELGEADTLVRLAFGTFLGLPDPSSFRAGIDYVHNNWYADPSAVFAAFEDRKLLGVSIAHTWGSLGYFGPLAVHPDYWNRGIGKLLIGPVIDFFGQRGIQRAGLFTHAGSTRHLGLYQKFGFWPRFLTAIMGKTLLAGSQRQPAITFSQLTAGEQKQFLAESSSLTDEILNGLSVEKEVSAVHARSLGDTAIVRDHTRLAGFAVCHCGPGTEAGNDICLVKFGAARPGPGAAEAFSMLLAACEALAAARGMKVLTASINTARHEAYRVLLEQGFSTHILGVTMHRPNEEFYSRPGVFLMDDWR